MKRSRHAITALLLLIAGCLMAFGARAQGVDPDKVPKIPHYTTLTEAQFETDSAVHKDVPQGDKYLAYSIRLPKGWRASSDSVSNAAALSAAAGDKKKANQRLLGKVGEYLGPLNGDFPSRIVIEAMSLDYDISARNWFLNYVLMNGFTLQGMDVIDKTRIEALYVMVEGDTTYVVRTIAQINGPRIVLASYYLPEASWNTERAVQEKAIESFTFDNPEQVRIEQTHTYAFLDLVRFDYPQSWKLLAPNIDSIDNMDARLISSKDDKTLNGESDLHLV
jgi:hypothetical protein